MNSLFTSTQMTHVVTLQALGTAANEEAARSIFRLYQERRPLNTQRAHRAALEIFTTFLAFCGIKPTGNLYEDPAAWQGVTFGLVTAFMQWLTQGGFAVHTINDRVSVVKTYLKMAHAAGYIPDGEIIRLQTLKSYSAKEGIDLDEKRIASGVDTRRGKKKATPTFLSDAQIDTLCTPRNDTPQARRDALMLCLMFDHAMRVSEVEDLLVENIDRNTRMITFYRRKTGKTSHHVLRGRTWQLLSEYLSRDNTALTGPLILASCKTGALIPKGMSTAAIAARVREIGQALGIESLSPHDLRHAAATEAGNDERTSLNGLMRFGGWESAAVAVRYMNRKSDAENSGVHLGTDAPAWIESL